MQKISILTLIIFCLIISKSIAQKPNEKYQYNIRTATSSLNINGVADDLAWESAETANNFFMITPMDTSYSRALTDVKMCYDKDNIYILVVNYKSVKGSIIVESLKRDFAFGKNDNFLLFMDTFDDKTNGFSFGANAAGAPWDGQQGDGGTVDLSWDNKWVSAVKNDDDKWVWEAAIPFKSIRYKPGITRWGINFSPPGPYYLRKIGLGACSTAVSIRVPRLYRRPGLGHAPTKSGTKYFRHSLLCQPLNKGLPERYAE